MANSLNPDSHPMADWPHELLRLWNKFALSGEVDAQAPASPPMYSYPRPKEVWTFLYSQGYAR